ncbi:MAG: Cation diffusion facilitator family transporter [Frankiales bacterium]|nr:Cation diffusion facilitator family transporter [Frankiales bacterium]
MTVDDDGRDAPPDLQAASSRTIIVAGAANLAIAVAKMIAAVISGSAAMLSEAAHSLADTVTEILLYVALRRGHRPADDRHPLGHGREAYLWALLAALATFTLGAGVSISQGIAKLREHAEAGDPTIAFVVLAVAFVIESVSLTQAVTQIRRRSRRWRMSPLTYLRVTTDTTVKAVAFEDSAALVGLLLAAAGLSLTHATGSPVWDGLASIGIGLLLVVVAVALVMANSALLVGRSALPQIEQALRADLEALPEVLSVPLLLTSVLGPEQLMVGAKVEFADHLTADDIERVADEAERQFTSRYPGIKLVFLDPTRRRSTARPDGPCA